MPNPYNAGPSGDGSRSLAKESKVGLLVASLATALGTALLSWLTNLDTSQWSGYWAVAGVIAVSALSGALSAWLKRNR